VGAWIETDGVCRRIQMDKSHLAWVRGLKLTYPIIIRHTLFIESREGARIDTDLTGERSHGSS